MSLELGLALYQRPEPRQYLMLGQRQLLTTLLSLRLEGKPIPNPVRGYDGMVAADTLLKERGASGLLFGGVAEYAWNLRRTKEELASRKDVDVAVLSDGFELEENFEGGIDWWLPYEDRIQVHLSDGDVMEKNSRYHVNGNNCVLWTGVTQNEQLPPGLYIPEPDFIVEMRKNFAAAHVDRRVTPDIDDEVMEAFERHVRRKVKTRLPGFIRDGFPGQILSDIYGSSYRSDAVKLEEYDLSMLAALNGQDERHQK